MKKTNQEERGQILVVLLFFTIMAITFTAAATAIIFINSFSGTRLQQGVVTSQAAEAGIENALLLLLRNPNYSGEILNVGDETVTVDVLGTETKTINSQASTTGFLRKIQVVTNYANSILNVVSWKEIFN